MPKPLLVITGPTAAGKTAFAIRLAQTLGGEIVSADSMQIYRGMDIGTAKPSMHEMAGIPHHMIDIADPAEPYSVARYVTEAAASVEDIFARGQIPILAGGTGLYIDSLLAGRYFAQSPDDSHLREELIRRYEREGATALWEELETIDPETAARLHPNDKKRVLRSIEVFRLTGKTITAHNEETQAIPPRYEALKIALTAKDRDALYRRIDQRVEAMMESGLQAEVAGLIQNGLSPACTAMQAIGYKEMAKAFSGELSLAEAVESIKQESRRYAKRQLSWLRRDNAIRWICWDKEPDINEAVQISTEFCRAFGIIET
ncbi:MAG: tRNA (adenosine(37)-N6)-dimethylallyltransferase MiaA [Oscillospiraceae bacterium]|nr:tRNA (adenosine(37)-N6)-dimethylallyltransferase MiaA [Oscillospiraceae bacterium]